MRLWAFATCCAALVATGAVAQTITGAEYAEPTTRYDHGILGDAVEWGALVLVTDDGRRLTLRLPDTRVFEDTAPRLADLDGDGRAEVVVVETDLALGARLAVYGTQGLIAATDFIGQTHRWLAPAGIGDLDRDGRVELAYVDRPHLAKVLRIVRMEGARLVEVAALDGLTNHRIGDAQISGGLRNCGQGPQIVLANADWTRIMAVRMGPGGLTGQDIGAFSGRFDAALACR